MQDILIEIEELIDENFRGSCILKVYQAYSGSSKSISLSVQEILARRLKGNNLTSLMRVMKKVRKRRKSDTKPLIQWISEFLVKINHFYD